MAVELADRFWAKVDRRGPDECWPWLGAKSPTGYGRFCVGKNRNTTAQRAAYLFSRGSFDPAQTIDHLCRNRGCVNPAHLEQVTRRENVLRGMGLTAQNARKTHCKNGHLLAGANLVPWSIGSRRCHICRNRWKAMDRARRRA